MVQAPMTASEGTAMISRQTAEHFTWREVCDGWYLVNQPDRLTVLHERMPPGSSEVRHLHRQAYQFFFILAGRPPWKSTGTTCNCIRLKARQFLPTWRTR